MRLIASRITRINRCAVGFRPPGWSRCCTVGITAKSGRNDVTMLGHFIDRKLVGCFSSCASSCISCASGKQKSVFDLFPRAESEQRFGVSCHGAKVDTPNGVYRSPDFVDALVTFACLLFHAR